MLRLGMYVEEDARLLVDILRDNGIKTESRPVLHFHDRQISYLKGRFSQVIPYLKDNFEEDFSWYQRYLDAIRDNMEEAKDWDDFFKITSDKLFPGIKEKIAALEDKGVDIWEGEPFEDEEDGPEEWDTDDGHCQTMEPIKEAPPEEHYEAGEMLLSGEMGTDEARADLPSQIQTVMEVGDAKTDDLERLKIERRQLKRAFIESIFFVIFSQEVANLNGFKPGKPVGEAISDPILKIVMPEVDDLPETPLMVRESKRVLIKLFEVLVDEASIFLADDSVREDLEGEFLDASYNIGCLMLLLTRVLDQLEEKKMNAQDFAEACRVEMDSEEGALIIDGKDAASEILRSLERGGILKVKGDKIKLRKY